MTTAEKIAELFSTDDGNRYSLPDGRWLPDVCEAEPGRQRVEHRGNVKWWFIDGSCLVETEGAGWDQGFHSVDAHNGCYCWEAVAADYDATGGHLPTCPHATTPCKGCSDPYTAEELANGLCEDCEFEATRSTCDDCGERYPTDEASTTEDGEDVCVKCWEGKHSPEAKAEEANWRAEESRDQWAEREMGGDR